LWYRTGIISSVIHSDSMRLFKNGRCASLLYFHLLPCFPLSFEAMPTTMVRDTHGALLE
jgi:hypothetical protein